MVEEEEMETDRLTKQLYQRATGSVMVQKQKRDPIP